VQDNHTPYTEKFIAHFWSCVDRSGECHVWQRAKTTAGYGETSIGRKILYAHRISYELAYGPVPQDLQVLHKCDNRACVNPAHLFTGTQQDNMDDMWAKGRGLVGERAPWAKLTEIDVREIHRLLAEGQLNTDAIGAQFNVSRATINHIRRGSTWSHLK
jgi:hypothetical protein